MSREPVVKLVANLGAGTEVQLERYVNDAGNSVKRKAMVPFVDDGATGEIVLNAYLEFTDITSNARLRLNTGNLKFEFWRQCLGSVARNYWDAAATNAGGRSLDNFNTAIAEFITRYMSTKAYHDQKRYLMHTPKPYAMDCNQLSARLTKIKQLMRFMPGAPDNAADILPQEEFKMVYHDMMPPHWRSNLSASGHDVSRANYEFQDLLEFMKAQEEKEATDKLRRRAQQTRGGRIQPPTRGPRGGRDYRGRGHRYQRGGRQYPQRYSGRVRSFQEYQGGYPSYPNQRPRYQYETPYQGGSYQGGSGGNYRTPGYHRGTPRGRYTDGRTNPGARTN